MRAMQKLQFGSVVCLCLLLTLLWGCGGSNSNNSGSTGSNGASSGTTTGNSNSASGSAGGTSAGGSNSGNTGNSSGSTGSTYAYAAVSVDGGGVVGYQQDSSGNLTSVSGSPYIAQGAATLGALAANNGYVYISNIASDASYTPELFYYHSDSSTGALTPVGTVIAGTNGDSEIRKLWVNSNKNLMYGVFQWTISSYSIGSNGQPALISSIAPSTDSVWGFDFVPNRSYAYAAIQNGNPKQGFQYPQIVLLNINGDGSLSINRTLLTMNTASGIEGDLKVDPSGRYVIVSNGQSNELLSVFAIQGDGSLTEVAASPFTTGSQQLRFLSFDSTGKYLYAVNQHAEQPQAEDVEVFSFDASTGKLTQIQDLKQPDQQIVTWFKVDGNYAYLTNIIGGNKSTITVFNRDANTGQLTQASVTNVDKALGQTDTLHQ